MQRVDFVEVNSVNPHLVQLNLDPCRKTGLEGKEDGPQAWAVIITIFIIQAKQQESALRGHTASLLHEVSVLCKCDSLHLACDHLAQGQSHSLAETTDSGVLSSHASALSSRAHCLHSQCSSCQRYTVCTLEKNQERSHLQGLFRNSSILSQT